MHIKNSLILSKVWGFFLSWKKHLTSVWLPAGSSTCTVTYRNASTIWFHIAVSKDNSLSHMLLWQGWPDAMLLWWSSQKILGCACLVFIIKLASWSSLSWLPWRLKRALQWVFLLCFHFPCSCYSGQAL